MLHQFLMTFLFSGSILLFPITSFAQQMLGVCHVEVGMAGASPVVLQGSWVYPTEVECKTKLPAKCNYYLQMASVAAYGQVLEGIEFGHARNVSQVHHCYPIGDERVKGLPHNKVEISYNGDKENQDALVRVDGPEVRFPGFSPAFPDAHRHLLPEGYLPKNLYETTKADRILTAGMLTILAAPIAVASWAFVGPALAAIELTTLGGNALGSATAATVATLIIKDISAEDLNTLQHLEGQEFENGLDLIETLREKSLIPEEE